jgi:hypothetical protein
MNSFNKTICTSCKVYYGSEERQGMCSVCFKDAKSKEGVKEPVKEIIKESLPPKEDEIMSSNIIQTEPINEVKIDEMIQTVTRPVQTTTHNCWVCNKKVGYLGFKCKCEYIFCGTHRHFSDHNCDFDYKSYDRSKLIKKSGLEVVDDNKMIK